MKKQDNLSIEIAREILPDEIGSAVALCVFADAPRFTSAIGKGAFPFIEELLNRGDFKGEADTTYSFHRREAESNAPRQWLLVGLGAHEDFDANKLRRAAGTAVRIARSARVRRLSFLLPNVSDEAHLARAAAEGALEGIYDNDFYQTQDEESLPLERFIIISANNNDKLRRAIEHGRIIAEAVNWTRELSDLPGRDLPPREFARRAAEMAAQFGLRTETLDAEEIQAQGMGGLWGIGKGSDEKPALIVVRYEPEGALPDDDVWAFVGKGITFDTGGISLKHGLDMYEMKADMAGGAAVLGALRAIAQLKPNKRIVGIVPAAENMPSGRSIKPGDVVRTLAGYTVEVVDTDAEGRMVLIDGIAYARKLGAQRIVDLATLTGSIIVALGTHRTGLFSNNDEWAARVQRAAERAGEPVWRMPVSDDYKKRIESDIADFKNYGGRPDATSAALLLSRFADQTPWVHLDIAGTSWYDDPQPHAPKGSSGVGVRTLVELVCDDSSFSRTLKDAD